MKFPNAQHIDEAISSDVYQKQQNSLLHIQLWLGMIILLRFFDVYKLYLVYIIYVRAGAYEPPKGWKERPTPHYSVERYLILTISLYGAKLKWVISVAFITNTRKCNATKG